MTPKVAADYGGQAAEVGLDDGLFSSFDMQLCDLVKLNPCGGGKGRRKRYPVVLFTPGLSDSRLLYGAGARSLASQGHAAVIVDHPHEAGFVEFPGRFSTGSAWTWARWQFLHILWAAVRRRHWPETTTGFSEASTLTASSWRRFEARA
ncbi:hypothetical protein J3458_012890 [Metarhizium acridum]|uniref:uncharacterized protein n=1 Tax=Metarhizium acridum TaxID=92637 RepID=UPI001C6A8E85|nr:hypothetical protein J3458_012890 [Metarhizium acridum]